MSKNEEMRRYFILGVKTLTVSLFNFEEKFEISPKKIFENEFKTLEKLNLATITDDYLSLTDIGKLFVDQISSIFFSSTEKLIPHPEEKEIKIMEFSKKIKNRRRQ